MPLKNPIKRRQYNAAYHSKRLGDDGTYNTLSNLTYPSYLDRKDPPCLWDSFKMGRRRYREFKTILPVEYPAKDGYAIKLNRIEQKGIDVEIKKKGRMDTVIELTNYKKDSYISDDDSQRYFDTFKKYECRKIMVISYSQNLSKKWRRLFIQEGIEIRVMTYQA